MLPSEYVKAMRDSMLDKCPVEGYKQVAQTINEELGKGPEELFASFEREPIASASLAQVPGLQMMLFIEMFQRLAFNFGCISKAFTMLVDG